MTELIRLQADGPIRTLTINQPETRNAISDPAMVDAVANTLARLNTDKTVRVIILTGAGKAFSAGGNLKRMGQPGELGGGEPIEIRRGYREGIQRIPHIFQTLEFL